MTQQTKTIEIPIFFTAAGDPTCSTKWPEESDAIVAFVFTLGLFLRLFA